MCCFYGHCPASHGRHIVEISIYPCLVTLSKRPISFAWFTLWVAGGQLGGRRRVSMEDNLRWKMTFDGRHPQSCKKNFSIRYPNFLLKNVWTLYLLNYAIKWRIILKNVCFLPQFSSFGVELCHESTVMKPFYAKMLKLTATIWKCPDFLPEMSGILDTRIPTYCNSVVWFKDRRTFSTFLAGSSSSIVSLPDSILK